MSDLMSLSQASAEIGVSAQTLKIQAQHGRLRAEKIGRDWLVTRAEVDRYRREVRGTRGVRSKPIRLDAASQALVDDRSMENLTWPAGIAPGLVRAHGELVGVSPPQTIGEAEAAGLVRVRRGARSQRVSDPLTAAAASVEAELHEKLGLPTSQRVRYDTSPVVTFGAPRPAPKPAKKAR